MKLLGSGADPDNGRVFMMWEDKGYQFRRNVLLWAGAVIPMHSHHYDHNYRIGSGIYGLIVESPEGIKNDEIILPANSTGFVPKFWKHHFRLVKYGDAPGYVECYWPDGIQNG